MRRIFILAFIFFTALPAFAQEEHTAQALLDSQEFHEQMKKAWIAIRCGFERKESSFVVDIIDSREKYSPLQVTKDVIGTGGGGYVAIRSHTIAVFHTHNNKLEQKPSLIDIAAAMRSKVVYFVGSQSGLWMVDPGGKVTQLYRGLDWCSKPKQPKS